MLIETRKPSETGRTGLGYVVLAGVLWGTGGLTGTLLGHAAGLSPLAVATYRLGVGGLLLVAFLLLRRRPQGPAAPAAPAPSAAPLRAGRLPRGRGAWTRIVVIGVLAAVFQASYFAAVSLITVSLATLLTIGMSPLLVLLAEGVSGRRRVGAAALGTAGLAVAGLTLLVGVPSGGRDPATVLAGGGFALLASAGFAAITFLGAKPVAGLDDLASTGLAFTLGSVALAPLAGFAGGLGFAPGVRSIVLLILLGVGPTAIAYAAYFRGLRTTPAGTAALMALLEPLVGAALAVLILGDRLGPAGVAGAALLIIALVLEQANLSGVNWRGRSMTER